MAKRRSAIDTSADNELIGSIDALRDEVCVLRQAVDELREELQYLVRNPDGFPRQETLPPLRIASLAKDPTAADFGERINAASAEKLDELREGAGNGLQKDTLCRPASQSRLF